MRALDEALDLLMRFDSVADDLLAEMRLRRRRNPFDEEVARDLKRVTTLLLAEDRDRPGVLAIANELCDIAEKYDRERRKAG